MGGFFTEGETKVRPGVYKRYENASEAEQAGVIDGIVACTIKSNWGPLGEVLIFNGEDEVKAVLGKENETTNVITEIFRGGASTVKAVRLGNGGTNATATLKDAEGSEAITITAKYAGSRKLSYLVRATLADDKSREFCIYEDGALLEKLTFAVSTSKEVDDLVAAGAKSLYFNFEKTSAYAGTGKLATVSLTEITPGTNPAITNSDYSEAFNLLETQGWNAICVDTNDVAVHALLNAFINRVAEEGKLGFEVKGEPKSVEFATRIANCRAFNDKKAIYVGGGWVDASGKTYEGYLAAARVAGIVAATPSNQSITHKVITGAIKPTESLTNAQIEQAIENGMIVFTVSAKGQVWIESGITTLVSPEGEDDAGWKKIKRCKVRMELMNRANDTIEPLIGKVNNNSDGRATVLQALQGVLNSMVAEEKLLPGATVRIDSANAPAGDSAWFVFEIDDVDSLEKIYLTYKFRFAPIA